MPRPRKATTDPFLQALIDKLPESDTDWPVDKQIAWLNLMAMGFGMVYGGDAAQQLGVRSEPLAAKEAAKLESTAKFMKPQKVKPAYPFMIDEGGYVVKSNGERVSPADVVGQTIHDMRGMDGDLRKIIWADGSIGRNGADLNISAA